MAVGPALIVKEGVSEVASQATGGSTDLLSLKGTVKGGWTKLKGLFKKGDEPAPTGSKSAQQTETETEQQVAESTPTTNVSPSELVSRQGQSEMTGNKVKRLKKKMEQEGYDSDYPVEYAEVDGKKILIDGHHRTAAARKARIKEIPAAKKDVTPDEASQLLDDAAEAAQERASRQR